MEISQCILVCNQQCCLYNLMVRNLRIPCPSVNLSYILLIYFVHIVTLRRLAKLFSWRCLHHLYLNTHYFHYDLQDDLEFVLSVVGNPQW